MTVLSSFKAGRHNHGSCVATAMEAAETLCRDSGQRLTPLRKRVLELVWASHAPARAYDVLDHLRQEGRSAAPPTVYRALEFLLENGLVHRIESLNAYVGCGAPGIAHSGQFLICGECHAVAELNDPGISTLLRQRADTLGFTTSRETIEVMGVCPACRGQASAR